MIEIELMDRQQLKSEILRLRAGLEKIRDEADARSVKYRIIWSVMAQDILDGKEPLS